MTDPQQPGPVGHFTAQDGDSAFSPRLQQPLETAESAQPSLRPLLPTPAELEALVTRAWSNTTPFTTR